MLPRLSDLPPLPAPIRALRDAVIVMIAIAIGGWVATIPYEPGTADPVIVQIFNAVFGTMGFAVVGHLHPVHRARHLALTVAAVGVVVTIVAAISVMHPLMWLMVLAVLVIMATLGGGLALLVEKLGAN